MPGLQRPTFDDRIAALSGGEVVGTDHRFSWSVALAARQTTKPDRLNRESCVNRGAAPRAATVNGRFGPRPFATKTTLPLGRSCGKTVVFGAKGKAGRSLRRGRTHANRCYWQPPVQAANGAPLSGKPGQAGS